MAGKFSMPRFEQEDLDSTQELPQLPEEFEPIAEDPIADYDYSQFPGELPDYSLDEDFPEDFDEELPEDFIDVALRVLKDLPGFFHRYRKQVLIATSAVFLAVIVAVIGTISLKARDPYDEKILNNLLVVDVLVGGMTKDQARSVLTAELADRYATQSMVLQLGDETITFSPADTGAKFNVQAAVDAAYAFGRTGTEAEREAAYQTSLSGNYALSALPYLELDKDLIRNTLKAFEAAILSDPTPSTYVLEGEAEDLSTEVFNPAASGQELIITLGTPKVEFDAEALYDRVLDNYSMGLFQLSDPGPVISQEPEPIDLDAIYQEFFLESVAPSLDMSDFDTIPGSYGRQFDLDAAKLLLAQAQPGDQLRIPMVYPSPEGDDPASVLYRDTLGTWSTDTPADENWKQNLRLACKTIHGTVLNPGDTFSFNAVVGQPSDSRGYMTAPSCTDASKTGAVGEGICQVASTLYISALLSDLEVMNRSAHSAPLSYTDWGLDADAKWGGADMVFRNTSIYPIRIETELSGGRLTVRIIGTDMRSYRTDMVVSTAETTQPKIIYEEYPYDNAEGYKDGDVIQEGKNGNQVKSYRCKYDKQSGDLIARDYIATSSYPAQDRILARVAPPVVETEPTDPPSETVAITLPTDPETGEVGDIEAVG